MNELKLVNHSLDVCLVHFGNNLRAIVVTTSLRVLFG